MAQAAAEAEGITPVMDLLFAAQGSSALLVCARLGLFDYISSQGEEGVSCKQLASRAQWSTRAASAVMVSLAASGILAVKPSSAGAQHCFEHSYTLTPRAQRFLVTEKPGSMSAYTEIHWEASPELLLKKAAETEDEKRNFMLETGGGAPSEVFLAAMQGQSSYAAMVLTRLVDLSDTRTFVDVGGGSGTFAIEACKATPNLQGVVYDLAGACPTTDGFIARAGMAERVKTHAGNMFEDERFPAADCYAFGNVLHDWSDQDNSKLLRKAFESLPAQGKVLLLEMLVEEDVVSTSPSAAGLNLCMVTNELGRQFKASELRAMLLEAGFAGAEVVSSPLTPYSLVVGTKGEANPVASKPEAAAAAESESITPLMDVLFSAQHSAVLIVCSRLGVFDFVGAQGESGASCAQVAAHAKWTTRAASAMLVSLACSGLLEPTPGSAAAQHCFEHSYRLTPLARRFLVAGQPGQLSAYTEIFWGASPKQLLEKASASLGEWGEGNFMLDAEGGAPSEVFLAAMQAQSTYAAMVLTRLVDLSDVRTFVDVGGGSGTLAIEACRAAPGLQGVVYDLAGACPVTDGFIARAGMAERVKTHAGNMFADERFPAADCYAFGNVLHDWSDQDDGKLLRKAFESLPANGKVLLLEMLLAEDVESSTRSATGLNIVMVTNEQGRQFKGSELEAMLRAAGFAATEVVRSPLTPYALVVGTKG